MKQNIKEIINFSLVFIGLTIILCGVPFYIFFISGENYNLDKVIIKQNIYNNKILFGTAYSDQTNLYKLKGVLYKQSDIIVMGSSRCLTLTEDYFNLSFYNACSTVSKIAHFKAFINKIPDDRLPKVFILSLDPAYFNINWDDGLSGNIEQELTKPNNMFIRFRDSIIPIYKDMVLRKLNNSMLKESSLYIGMYSKMNKKGYKRDGSYEYGNMSYLINVTKDINFIRTKKYIDKGIDMFTYGENVSEISIIELDKLLNYLNEKDVYVVGIILPFPNITMNTILMKKNKYSYMFKLSNELSPIFIKYNYSFLDYYNIYVDDNKAIDGIHLSKEGARSLYNKMINETKRLKQNE